MAELVIDAVVENIDKVFDFIHEQLEETDCPMKAQMQIDLAVDEIFANISNYAYNPETGYAKIICTVCKDPLRVEISFEDGGKPYNPLEKEDPDVTLPVEDRPIGGLGIFLVKKNMDSVDYEYKDGKNILTIKKEIEK
ncbi:MAG: ATP-binding protein [Lachnospiraceae bacterium]|nr:ATP-binding protein [Lachnospiraceae bacterium]